MASGHTDKDTINQRRKPTPRMMDLMHHLFRPDRVTYYRDLTEGDKNALRGLRDRGWIVDDQGDSRKPIQLNEAGEAFMRSPEAARTARGSFCFR